MLRCFIVPSYLLMYTVASTATAQQPAIPSSSLVLDGVTVVDVEHGTLLPDQRIVIVGNRVQSMGGVRSISIPQGSRIIDARQQYVIPGLWDMHVHTRASLPYRILIANGVTGIRDGYSSVPLDTMVQWWREILAGRRVGPPRQLLTGDYQDLHQGQTDRLTDAELNSRKARGANFIKLYPFTPASAARVRRAGLRFGGHVEYLNPITFMMSGGGQGGYQGWSVMEASDSGMSIIDHLNTSGDLDDRCWGGVASANVTACQLLTQRFRQNNTWWVPTLVAFADERWVPAVAGPASLPIADRLRVNAEAFWAGSLPHDNWLRESIETHGQRASGAVGFLDIARRADMPILLGTDTPLSADLREREYLPGFSVHAELAMYVAEGLTPLQALQSATINPSKMLHGTDSLGLVAPGKLADLVLLDADPLVDITNTTAIRAVIANGRYYDRLTLDRLLDEARAEIQKIKQEP